MGLRTTPKVVAHNSSVDTTLDYINLITTFKLSALILKERCSCEPPYNILASPPVAKWLKEFANDSDTLLAQVGAVLYWLTNGGREWAEATEHDDGT